MKYTLKKVTEKPFLHSKSNIVTDINGEFTKLTGYIREEIIGKSLTEVSCMLRIDSQVYLGNIEDEHNCYMFTEELEPREITIYCRSLNCQNEKTYFINEKQNSRIEDLLPYVSSLLSNNEKSLVIYSFPNGILLKANKKFNDYAKNQIENIIGRSPQKDMKTIREA